MNVLISLVHIYYVIEKLGIGIDICDINRFKKIPYSTNKKFYKKIFTLSEIKYCIKFKNPYPRFAGKFAVKEAVIKSTNLKLNFLDINTSHSNSKPTITIKPNKNKFLFKISISHEKDFAIGLVISEKIN